jgi:two-component system sensor histidine kinase GlrK
VSAYALSQLSHFRKVTGGILQNDSRMRELEQNLADSILTLTRYERKYIITKDKELHNQFMIAERNVGKRIHEAMSIADTARKREILTRIKDHYARYRAVFHKEAGLIRKDMPYAQDRYGREKKKAVDGLLRELKNLKLYTEQDTYEKIRQLDQSGAKANKIAVVMSVSFILAGIIISIFITGSITRPLSFMRKKTRQVAGGDFESNLDLSDPPEIGELARDFNRMCSKLQEADKMKSDFFSLMAHELRMPLASIKEGTDLLLRGMGEDLKEKRKEVLTIIAEESNHLIELVNSLLDLSKMEAGMIALRREESDIRSLVNKAVYGMRPLSMAKNVSIETEMPGELSFVPMDEERILQALRNLIGNAVKFTPGGGRITISVRPAAEGVGVSVADTGPGIPPEDLRTIFDKFQQANMTGYNKIKGTGLGLAIVKHIVNAHGGKVWVESEMGRGSTFGFLLPR